MRRMSFICPACNTGRLEIRTSLEMPADGRSDENTLQAIECRSCGFTGVAVYEESRRGADDSWHHDGAPISRETFAALIGDIARCAHAGDRKCRCEMHLKYDQRSNYNWRGLDMFELTGALFAIRR